MCERADRRLAEARTSVTSTPVSERYQIQDIVAQDELGVQFLALDVATGDAVGVRRFFPFGRDGGGLEEFERDEYQRGVAEMAALKHPALRAVLTGGCDPVDGFPYLVTEWIEGEVLSKLLERGEFEPDAAVAVLDRALQLCEAISAKLGVEAMWLDTSPETVVLAEKDGARGFTFGISPVRWLVECRDRRSLLPMVTLAEDLMGWRGRLVGEQAGGGLGAWIKWLRGSAQSVSIGEARRMLARMTGREPWPQDFKGLEPQAAVMVAEPPEPAATVKLGTRTNALQLEVPPPRVSRPHWKLVAALALVVGLVGWWVIRHPRQTAKLPTPAEAEQTQEAKRLAEINARAAALSAQGGESLADTVFQAEDSRAILNEKGKRITVEGVVNRVKSSDSGARLYLEFSGDESNDVVRGRVVVASAGEDLAEEELRKWVNKRVRITGEVKIQSISGGASRPEVLLESGDSIKEAP